MEPVQEMEVKEAGHVEEEEKVEEVESVLEDDII